MNDAQWEQLQALLAGEVLDPLPVGFIIDSPWLPNWAGMSIMDYFASDERWFEANMQAIRRFPDIMFLPGFWSEYAMCSEPASFGARCVWADNDLPFAETILADMDEVGKLKRPDPRTDGLTPFILKRLVTMRPRIEAEGHKIRFAVARGPLNIATFLMGNMEFMTGLKIDPDAAHRMVGIITDFLVDWIQVQARAIPTIEGVLLLDDIVGFLGPDDFQEFALPYLQRCFGAIDGSVRFFHNDAHGLVCAPYLEQIGVNLFNFSHNHPMEEMRRLVGDSVSLLGNVPPRDVLALGAPGDVTRSVVETLAPLSDRRRILFSGGGGMSPGTPTENLEAFLAAAGHGR